MVRGNQAVTKYVTDLLAAVKFQDVLGHGLFTPHHRRSGRHDDRVTVLGQQARRVVTRQRVQHPTCRCGDLLAIGGHAAGRRRLARRHENGATNDCRPPDEPSAHRLHLTAAVHCGVVLSGSHRGV